MNIMIIDYKKEKLKVEFTEATVGWLRLNISVGNRQLAWNAFERFSF